MANTVRVAAQVTGVGKASSELDRLRDKFEKLQKGGAKGFAIGAGAAITAGAFGLLAGAGSKALDVMGDIVEGAMADEESIARLTTSLQANVPGWDGVTTAIEKNIKAAQRLGFEDDELRDSLTGLLGATHDVAKAQAIQNTAMDLARFKKISLADASEALTKVEAGSFRILKSLGIVLKDGATQTEALAAVQAVAAGQAEKYAETNRGKLLASQIKLNESFETFGTKVLPGVIETATGAADALSGLATVLDMASGNLPKTTDEVHAAEEGIVDLWRAVAVLHPAFGVLADVAEDNMTDVSESSEDMRGRVGDALADVGDAAVEMKRDMVSSASKVEHAFGKLRTAMAKDAQGIIDDFFDPIETRAELFDNRAELRAAEEALRLSKSKTEHRNAADDIIQSLDDEASTMTELGETGKLTAKDVDTFAADVKRAYKSMGKVIPPELQKIIDRLRILAKLTSKPFVVTVKGARQLGLSGTHAGGGGPQEFAEGGVVKGPLGSPQLAIVHGGETVIPTGQHGGGGAMMLPGATGTTMVLNLTVNAAPGMSPGQARALADSIAPSIFGWGQRNGILPRTGTGLTG